jgi:serine phosphatase RsbU (regulator of sigma subunit)
MLRLTTDAAPTRPTEREMRRAQEVQAGFLPRRTPQLATLECAGVTLPAQGLGGDYYDFIKLSPRRLAIVLADISGKGIAAALMTASLQASLRSHYALGVGDLAARLRSTNRLFFECVADGRFATLFLGEYDDRTRRLRYANCGHVPPMLLRCDGSHEWLAPTAGVLGIRDDWACEVAEVALGPGDTLLVCSDGVTEARDGALREFGDERLAAAVLAARRLAPAALLEVIVEEVRRFSGGALVDDLTLVAARPRLTAGPGWGLTDSASGRLTQGRPRKAHADLHPSR